ncbi:pentatricopeptide repeat-containing protein At1g06140, mitochondrial-like [Selaginella moellendorffii]|uniref:pentatricopeptide repeat-containing protein At1g06140, mitochondrial-like n=1 Tax=Selaginella moellendorffii TaxID=88036 RepID=UPI000D1CA4EF|nr:pentatricopeptide repeat-containing protein At1g06140, mitochondrial-like [Selaginella moellendorffii]|eukprot:XP_024532921.1 pentatricopeptide repeat-containing protein At1g06140, mitochondrial-like [Selaginella moellendorffii]
MAAGATNLVGVKSDAVTLVSAVDCCAGLGDLQQSQAFHARVLAVAGMESNEFLGSALLTMFVRCKALDRARATFEAMEAKSVVPWTAMIAAYAQIARPREAFRLFQRMAMEGVRPNAVTFLGILEGFATRASFHHGRLIHACFDDGSAPMALEFAPPSRIKVSNAILDMYARCGSVDDARAVFDRMASRTNISWTSMVAAYAQNGHPSLALEISREMDQVGMSKNAITFITILSACNHGGLLEEGIRFLAGMRRDHGVLPSNAHYSCVIDLLGKAGRLEEAESMITGLVERPDAGLWRSLLGSCRIHGDEERAGRAGEELKKLEPSDAAPYVVKKLFLLET